MLIRFVLDLDLDVTKVFRNEKDSKRLCDILGETLWNFAIQVLKYCCTKYLKVYTKSVAGSQEAVTAMIVLCKFKTTNLCYLSITFSCR